MIQLRNITVERSGRALLRDISLDIRTGGPTAVMGVNGAGKTLLLQTIAGLHTPASGSVRAPACALVLQDPPLLNRSVLDNVRFVLGICVRGQRDHRAVAGELLARCGLGEALHEPALQLSRGNRQRLAIARALAQRAPCLLLDEPSTALDIHASMALEEIIREAHRAGTTVVMSTHSLAQAHRLAEDVIFLHEGRVAEHTAMEDFLHRPQSQPAQAFVVHATV